MKKVYLFLVVLNLFNIANAKELFIEKDIFRFLNRDNPYINSILGEKDIYYGKLKYYKGYFDTKLGGKYEKKEYPLSESKYNFFYVEQPTLKGFDFLFGYRKATGVQEYSNVKTSKDGELIFGVKIPVFQVANNIDFRRLKYFNTKIEISQKDYEIIDKLRKIYTKILEEYYKTIYYKEILTVQQELLEKAIKRKNYIEKKISLGSLPEIASVEVQQQIINRKQKLLKAENDFRNSLNNFVRYLNLNSDEFLQKYELPQLTEVEYKKLNIKEIIQLSINNSPKLKVYNLMKKRLYNENKFYSLKKLPDINFSVYIVNDFKYDQGYKFSMDFSYYTQNRQYLGKKIEIAKNLALIRSKEQTEKINIKTKIQNLLNKLETIKENIEMSKKEIELSKKLENAERKKFELGLSDLFYLNQREIYTLKTIKKYLSYKKDYWITYKKLLIEINPLKILELKGGF